MNESILEKYQEMLKKVKSTSANMEQLEGKTNQEALEQLNQSLAKIQTQLEAKKVQIQKFIAQKREETVGPKGSKIQELQAANRQLQGQIEKFKKQEQSYAEKVERILKNGPPTEAESKVYQAADKGKSKALIEQKRIEGQIEQNSKQIQQLEEEIKSSEAVYSLDNRNTLQQMHPETDEMFLELDSLQDNYINTKQMMARVIAQTLTVTKGELGENQAKLQEFIAQKAEQMQSEIDQKAYELHKLEVANKELEGELATSVNAKKAHIQMMEAVAKILEQSDVKVLKQHTVYKAADDERAKFLLEQRRKENELRQNNKQIEELKGQIRRLTILQNSLRDKMQVQAMYPETASMFEKMASLQAKCTELDGTLAEITKEVEGEKEAKRATLLAGLQDIATTTKEQIEAQKVRIQEVVEQRKEQMQIQIKHNEDSIEELESQNISLNEQIAKAAEMLAYYEAEIADCTAEQDIPLEENEIYIVAAQEKNSCIAQKEALENTLKTNNEQVKALKEELKALKLTYTNMTNITYLQTKCPETVELYKKLQKLQATYLEIDDMLSEIDGREMTQEQIAVREMRQKGRAPKVAAEEQKTGEKIADKREPDAKGEPQKPAAKKQPVSPVKKSQEQEQQEQQEEPENKGVNFIEKVKGFFKSLIEKITIRAKKLLPSKAASLEVDAAVKQTAAKELEEQESEKVMQVIADVVKQEQEERKKQAQVATQTESVVVEDKKQQKEMTETTKLFFTKEADKYFNAYMQLRSSGTIESFETFLNQYCGNVSKAVIDILTQRVKEQEKSPETATLEAKRQALGVDIPEETRQGLETRAAEAVAQATPAKAEEQKEKV